MDDKFDVRKENMDYDWNKMWPELGDVGDKYKYLRKYKYRIGLDKIWQKIRITELFDTEFPL